MPSHAWGPNNRRNIKLEKWVVNWLFDSVKFALFKPLKSEGIFKVKSSKAPCVMAWEGRGKSPDEVINKQKRSQ